MKFHRRSINALAAYVALGNIGATALLNSHPNCLKSFGLANNYASQRSEGFGVVDGKQWRNQETSWSLQSTTDNASSSNRKNGPVKKGVNGQKRIIPRRKNRGKHSAKKTHYENWLQETYTWIESTTTPLPFEICQNAHDLIRGFVKVFPIGSAGNAPVRYDCAKKTDYLLRRFVQEKEANNVYAEYLPNLGMYRLAMEAWTACAHSQDDLDPAKNAHAILNLMIEQSQIHEHVSPPNIACYNALINAYAYSGTEEGIEEANKLLLFLEKEYEQSVEKCKVDEAPEPCPDFRAIKPTTVSYNTLFNAIVKLRGDPKTELARSLLDRMEYQYSELGNSFAEPTSYSYTSVMSLFTTNGHALEGQKILEQMERMWKKSKVDALKPDTITCNTVMACWANSGLPEAGERAQAIIENMAAKPNRKSYHAVLLAQAKSGEPSKAQEILDKMQVRWEAGDNGMKPDVRTFTTVMNAWGRSNDPNAASNAHDILEHMNKKYDATKDKTIKPNKFSYTAVLDAYAFSAGRTDAAEKAEGLLNEMKIKSGEDNDLKPDVRSYNAVLNAYSRSAGKVEVGDDADRILREMENTPGLNPDGFSYNSVILAHVRAHNIESAQKALLVLKRMEEGFKAGNKAAKPISNNYYSVISSLAANSNQSDPEVALAVTDLLKTLQSTPGLRADRFCYSAALYAWSRSNDRNKGKHAYAILNEMREKGIDPDVLNYITVMNACAHTTIPEELNGLEKEEEQGKIFDIAKNVFKELQASHKSEINETAYGVFLRCTRILLPRQDGSPREKLIMALFKKISEDGLVSERIVKEIMSKGEENLVKELLGDYADESASAVYEKLPQNWKSRVGTMVQRDWKGNVIGK